MKADVKQTPASPWEIATEVYGHQILQEKKSTLESQKLDGGVFSCLSKAQKYEPTVRHIQGKNVCLPSN